jgi:hypothetical protein
MFRRIQMTSKRIITKSVALIALAEPHGLAWHGARTGPRSLYTCNPNDERDVRPACT